MNPIHELALKQGVKKLKEDLIDRALKTLTPELECG